MLGPVSDPLDCDVSRRIDVLRILLVGLLVLARGAAGVTVRINGTGPATSLMLAIVNGHVEFVAVPLFFAISGFLFLRGFTLSLAAYGGMLRRKCISLLVPYLLFNLGLAGWLYCVGSIETIGSWGYLVQQGVFTKVLGLGTSPINAPLWLVRDLLVIFFLSPVLLLFFKEAPGVGLVTLFVLWVGINPEPYSIYGNLFAFYLGGYLARSRLSLSGVSWWQRWGAPAFFLLTAVLVAARPLGLTVEEVRLFLFKCNLLLGLIFFWYIASFPLIRDNVVLHRLARYSFFIYLAHEPTVSLFQTCLLSIWKPIDDIQQIVFYWLTGLAVIGALWGIGAVLSRTMPGVYAVATGARRSGPRPGAPLLPGRCRD